MDTNTKRNKLAIGFIIGAAVVAVISRLIPHVPNFTAMESLTLFAGAYLGKRVLTFILPLVLWYASDLIINNTTNRIWYTETEGIVWFSDYMITVYIGAILVLFLGANVLKKWTASKLAITSVSASLIFWTISNMGTWMSGTLYEVSFAGLATCFTAALPFLATSILSNLVYAAVLFGGYEWVYKSYFQKANVSIPTK